jgi:8-oxo-dGTP pyrophosphatase MutT (NUDIX family)
VPGAPDARRRGHVRRARRAAGTGLTLSERDDLARGIRAVLLDPEEAIGLDVHGRTDAAVLVPLYLHDGDLHVVLTRRPGDMRRHAGEVAFPGGRQDDGEDLRTTALREAEEEVGLPRGDVELLGALKPVPTLATGYAIYPFVGLIEPGREWVLSPREVEEVIEPSLSDLRAGFDRRRIVRRGIPLRTDVYIVGDAFIWGATARMLSDLLQRLGAVSLPA